MLIRLFAANLGAQLARIVSSVLLLAFASRSLDAAELGRFLLAQSAAILGSRLYAFGLQRSIVGVAASRSSLTGHVVCLSAQAVFGNVARLGVAHVLFSAALVRLDWRQPLELARWLVIIEAWAISLALAQVWAEALRSNGRDLVASLLQGVGGGVLSGGVALLTLAGAWVVGVSSSAIMFACFVALGSVVVVAGVLVPFRATLSPASPAAISSLRRGASPAGVSQLAIFALNESPIWLATGVLGESASVPIILAKRVAVQAGMLPHMLSVSVGVVSYRDMIGAGDDSHRRRVGLGFMSVFVLIVAAGAVVAFWSDPLVWVFGGEMRGAERYVIPFMLPAAIMALTGGATYLVQMTDASRISTRWSLALGTVVLVLSYLALWYAGAVAMAYTFGVGMAAILSVDYVLLRTRLGYDRSPATLWRRSGYEGVGGAGGLGSLGS